MPALVLEGGALLCAVDARLSHAGDRRKKKATESLEFCGFMVGLTGFEPATSCSQSRRATKLRYSPFMHSRTWQVNTSFHCSVW